MNVHKTIGAFMKPVEQIVLGNGAVLARNQWDEWYHSAVWNGGNLRPHRVFSLQVERLVERHGVVSHDVR